MAGLAGTVSAYAKHRAEKGWPGANFSGVRYSLKTGRIKVREDGLIDFDAADAAWPGKTAAAEALGRGPVAEKPIPSDQNAPTGDPEDYIVARARRESAAADMAEMEAAQARGELLRYEEILASWGEVMATVRARLMVLPSMVAPLVAAPGQIAEAQATILKFVNEALSELAAGLPKPSGRGERSDGAASPPA